MWPTTTLAPSDLPTPSVDALWRPLVSVAVVTQLVTHPPEDPAVLAVTIVFKPHQITKSNLRTRSPIHKLAAVLASPPAGEASRHRG